MHMSSNEITDIGVMAGKAYGTAPLSADMQYLETYTSSALNRKLKGIVRSGFYLGFSPVAGSGLNIVVTSKGAEGGQGAASIDVNAHQITVQHLADLTLPVVAGKTTRIVLEANYKLGVKTDQVDITSTVEAARVFAQDISVALEPNQLELCRVLVPTGTTQVTQAMIITNYRINRQVGITLDSIYTSDDELIAANLKGLKILKGMIDNNMVIANNGSDIHDKAMFRENIELDKLVNEKQLIASENLADLPDVPEARGHLGLGTAALANQQTNPMDMTAGALMAVGAFGMGSPSFVLDSKITSLTDVSVTEQNAFWTLSGTFSDGPIDLGKTTQTLRGQLFNMRRKYDADAALLQLLVAQGGVMYLRLAGKVSGDWSWSGLSDGADKNGWRKVMDSASMTLADLVKAGAAKAGDNDDITSTSKLTSINTPKLTVSKNLDVGSQISAGFRIGVIRSEPSVPSMTFLRTDQLDDKPPAYETDVMQIVGRVAAVSGDAWSGRILGGITTTNMTHGGGKISIDARTSTGVIAARLALNSGDGLATLQGAGGLTITGGGGLSSDGAAFITADTIALQMKPKTKDNAYYLRGRKADNTLHWYMGQSTDSTDTVTWGNSIPNTWLTLSGDGTGETNVSTMNFRNNAIVGGNLMVAGGADFTGPVNVLAKGATAVGDLTNAALVVTGSKSDGTQGITVNSFAPTVTFIDRDADAAGFRLRGDGSSLRLDVDGRDNGVTWNQNIALFSDKGHLALGSGSDSTSRMLTLGSTTPGKGNMSGASQIVAMAYANIGADATTRGIGFGVEMSVGDGNTGQTVAEVVEFWGNSSVVNKNAAVALMSSFRGHDKASPVIATAYAFEGLQTAREGLNRWNLFMQGTAPNYMRGQTIIGGTDIALPVSSVGLDVRTDARFKGQVSIEKKVTIADEIVQKNGGFAFRAKSTDYAAILRNDNESFYLLATNKGDTDGKYNDLRPIAFNLATGTVRMEQGLVVLKSIDVDGRITANTLNAINRISIGNAGTGNFNTTSGSINIGDSDTGFVCPGDGILDSYANNVLTTRTTVNKLYVYGRVVAEDADGFRIRPATGQMGMIHRFDGSNYYLLVTNANDPDGTWNNLRPFAFNGSTGIVTMSHNVNVGGALSVSGSGWFGGNVSVQWGGRGVTYQENGDIVRMGNVTDGYTMFSNFGGNTSLSGALSWIRNQGYNEMTSNAMSDFGRGGQQYSGGSGTGQGRAYEVPGGCVLTGINTNVSDGRGMGVYFRQLIGRKINGGQFGIGDFA